MKIQGIVAALATPFDYRGSLYKAKVQHNVEKWNKVSLGGYLVASPTGEGAALTFDERVELFGLVAHHAVDRALIADVSREGVEESAQLAERAAGAGYHFVLCRPAAHWPCDTAALYVRCVADRSTVPVVSPVACEHPNVITNIPLLLDSASGIWAAFAGGAPAVIASLASASPYACLAIWEAFRSREEEAGLDWQSRVARAGELSRAVPALKHAMDLNGYYGGPPRLPFAAAPRAAHVEIEEAFRDLKG
jgi:4-hydroxy-2-oxoglutarate aldolase